MAHETGDVEREILVVIPLFHPFTTLDAIGPYEALHMIPRVTMQFVSTREGEAVTTDIGLLQLISIASFTNLPNPHIIVVRGRPRAFIVINDTALIDWLKKAHITSTYTTSVCTGALAGLLEGLTATTHWEPYGNLAAYGAIPTETCMSFNGESRMSFLLQCIVLGPTSRHGKIITSAGISSGIDMALHLITLLKGEEVAKMVKLLIEYDPQPPYDVGAPSKAGEELVEKTRQFSEYFINTLPAN
ncbi:hypothetical protein KP509_02G044100 [Ceratopteris richardii]|uniref:DJ-1/PfpI domain-containing protein n=1 Tax=Ceratopteris richardii TaxID=49495 RepID=A0A8T2V8W8_CERRI|nr:hypothetical protein KP509_02G044100 [Ceratopteris richardii]